ncbi:MAG: ribosome biogenesis GTPase Der [Verrucomicrobia bacterium]|nr:ribosome biogenesis GTPase Der [Verrucomicrobiota bacterium]
MKKFKLALVGRPNVGKSALFNRLCGARISIVDDEEGTTRDRIYGKADFFGRSIDVIDTGGIANPDIPFQEGIQRQAEIAIEEADTIVMVVDGQVGVTPADEHVAQLLIRSNKPVCLAVNKVDDYNQRDNIFDFYRLGIEKILPISATHGFQIAELLETAFEGFSFDEQEESIDDGSIKVAIVGRPNVGKSTLLNYLLSEERSVVSPVAGTTRDAIDAHVTIGGTALTLIDTAGIRRKRAEHEAVEKFAAIRTERAIERADICILVLDAKEGMTTHDKRIASMIEAAGKGCILIFNKWDLVEGYRMEHCLKSLRYDTAFLSHCPALFISALTGRNVSKIMKEIVEVRQHQLQRITTGQLNKFIERAIQVYHPPMIQGKRLRIYYMAHVETQPPTFVLFVNYPKLMLETYKRYLITKFRETYKFTGNPLLFVLRDRKREARFKSSEPTEAHSDA